ncbi:hypothetical protein SAMN05421736_101747 [Evansella caseinilytica]|uniref:Uncharacterized protein n=1 Tax=Evansella caseinilytica TaxID=1503961 RepID=A0A1H3I8X5_9BACI|nr:hypothetical protein [Evansella caseinilytica]SDY23925.1 hypothetical protein SAMN05421736_101747 [Evansella caseinilytica]
MNYFQVLSIVFGSVLILTRLAIQFFPKKWNDFELNTAYTEEQPKWVWVVAAVGLLLVGFTWYKHFTTDVAYSLAVTLLLTLTLLKTSQVLFNYQQFRRFAVRVLTKDRKVLAVINIVAFLLGLGALAMGLFLY